MRSGLLKALQALIFLGVSLPLYYWSAISVYKWWGLQMDWDKFSVAYVPFLSIIPIRILISLGMIIFKKATPNNIGNSIINSLLRCVPIVTALLIGSVCTMAPQFFHFPGNHHIYSFVATVIWGFFILITFMEFLNLGHCVGIFWGSYLLIQDRDQYFLKIEQMQESYDHELSTINY